MPGHLVLSYWDWAGSNVGAMPACGAIAVLFAVCFRKPLARWWHKHFGVKAELADIKSVADAAHRIAADLLERLLRERHPDSPERKGTDDAALPL